LLLSDKVEHAILFEPNPLAAARARQNIARNQLGFEVYELALSDATGEVGLEGHGGVDTVSHIVVHGQTNRPGTIIVRRVTFDEFLAEHGNAHARISVVKIDVEGHENSVLRGMKRFLLEQRPPLIMFEYLQRTNIQETLQFFEDIRYQVFELTNAGPMAVSGKIKPLQDLFACPQERMEALGVAKVAS
jgi:FkbM family methyltransferase